VRYYGATLRLIGSIRGQQQQQIASLKHVNVVQQTMLADKLDSVRCFAKAQSKTA